MPSIAQALIPPATNWSKSEPLSMHPEPRPMPTPAEPPYRPTKNLRCPLPPTNAINPDNIRQLYSAAVQVQRVIPPQAETNRS